MIQVWNWLLANGANIAAIVTGVMGVFALIVRLTPTTSDDGFFAKVDGWVNAIFDFLKIPNVKK
jgi:hypothetical protein